ncbi:MAG: DNA recombination protein RmuC [Clostridiales bacterium]|nr:DNA recombination protein RmuC [Clostridiales bacterium]
MGRRISKLADLSKQSEDTILRNIDGLILADRHDRQSDAANNLQYLQGVLYAQAEATANRMDALGSRLDQANLGQEDRLRNISKVLDERLSANDQKVERMRETLYQGVANMQRENAQKLDEMRKTVDENLHATLNRRLGESFQQVSERLEQVYLGLGEMKTLASGVGDLKRVLSNVKSRGSWGEAQLGSLLGEVLIKGQFEENVAVKPGSQERVEYAIILPGLQPDKPVYMAIDAKFPMEAYERLQTAQDTGEKLLYDQARAALAQAIKIEGGRIASKYIAPPYTVDFALMYLPNEGLYAQVLQIPGLADELQRKYRVVPAGPTTLNALLNSLQMGFRTLAIEQRSGEVWRLLSIVKAEFGRFGDILDKTQQRLRQASESIEDASRKTRTIENKLKNVESLEQENISAADIFGEDNILLK